MSLVHEALKRAAQDHSTRTSLSQPRKFHFSSDRSPISQYILLAAIGLAIAISVSIYYLQRNGILLGQSISPESKVADSPSPSAEVLAQPVLRQESLSRKKPAELEDLPLESPQAVDLAPAILLYRGGKYDEAERQYRSILSLTPDDPVVYINLGLTLKSLGRINEAEESYHRALEIDPDRVEALNNLALLYDDRNRLEEAMRLYRKALRIDPGYAAAHLNYASALERSGFQSEARRHFEAFLIHGTKEHPREIELVRQHLQTEFGSLE